MATKTAAFERYHVYGTRGTFMLRLTYRGYPRAEQPYTGREAMRAMFAIAQAQGFTHAHYEDERGKRARVPLNKFYDLYCN